MAGVYECLKVETGNQSKIHRPSGYRDAVTRRLQCAGLHHRQQAVVACRRPAWRFHHRGFHCRINCGRPAWRIHNRGLPCLVICGRPAWCNHNRGLPNDSILYHIWRIAGRFVNEWIKFFFDSCHFQSHLVADGWPDVIECLFCSDSLICSS